MKIKITVAEHAILSLLIFLCYCQVSFQCRAQEIEPIFMSISDGLVNPNVQDVIQDSYGLLWIATANGMQSYDGNQFETFKNIPGNAESLLNNVVWGLAEDSEGNIWAASDKGISKFDRQKRVFKNYDLTKQFNFSREIERVFNITQDSKKRLWATTGAKGLLRYNPIDDQWVIAPYAKEDSLAHNSTSLAFTEDPNGGLWLGSSAGGLMYSDGDDLLFKTVDSLPEEVDFTEGNNRITSLYADASGIIWITTRNGIYKYDPLKSTLKTIIVYDYNREDQWNNWNAISQDHQGNIWVANNYRGILKFDGITDNYQEMIVSGAYRLKGIGWNITFTDFTIDKSGIFWFGNRSRGLMKYDPEKKPFTHYKHEPENKNSLSSSGVFGILASEIHPGILYVGTRSGGLNIFDTKSKTFRHISYKAVNDFYGGAVRSIAEDDDGTLWIGTWGDGLIKLDQNYNEVKRYVYDPNSDKSISDNKVRVIKKDKKGNLWIGTNNGLNIFQPDSETFKRIPGKTSGTYTRELIERVEKLSKTDSKVGEIANVIDFQNLYDSVTITEEGNYLVAFVGEGDDNSMADIGWLENEKNDTIWDSFDYVKTYYAGGASKNRIKIDLIRLDPGNYTLRYSSDDSHSFDNWNEAPPDKISLYGIELLKLSDEKIENSTELLLKKSKQDVVLSGVNISAITLTDNTVWVGTSPNGLNKINTSDSTLITYYHDPDDPNSLSNNTVFDMTPDEKGNIWITTQGGINRFDPETEGFIRFTETDGLPTNLTESILAGDNGEMWISSQSGLSQMVVNESLGKVTFINYNAEDGLGGDAFLAQTAARTPDGKFYFGGDHGLNVVSRITTNNVPPDLLFTDLLISNTSVYDLGKNSPIAANLSDQDVVRLSFDQNNLSFEFAALHYANPKKNQYAHFLKGYDKDWVYDNRNYASYTNLDPGEYEFFIRASNAYGIWNEEGKSISVIIAPPWYRTRLAYFVYVLLFFTALYGFDRIMRRRLIRKERERSRERELAQAKEIEKAYTELKATQSQLIQSEKMASLGELTAGIAHEIQNPLNFVNNFSEVNKELLVEMMEEIENKNFDDVKLIADDVIKNEEKISHHGKRADAIVKGMLQHSRTNNGQRELTDINLLADEYLRLAYHGLRAKDKSFNADFKFEPDEKLPKINAVQQDIGRVLLNLINNAFYAVSAKASEQPQLVLNGEHLNGENSYKPEVRVSTAKLADSVEVSVKDNGPGIPEDVKEKIFQPFFTTKPAGRGTGLGLSMSYDIVKAHGGEIKLESSKKSGTQFSIILPIK